MIGLVKLWKWIAKKTEAYTVQVPYQSYELVYIGTVVASGTTITNNTGYSVIVSGRATWGGSPGDYNTTIAAHGSYSTGGGSISTININVSGGNWGTSGGQGTYSCYAYQYVTRYRTETRYREVDAWYHR